jgi:hypothetical protein
VTSRKAGQAGASQTPEKELLGGPNTEALPAHLEQAN